MSILDVLAAINQVASGNGLSPLTVGPAFGMTEIEAVEANLGALLPIELFDYLSRFGRVDAWGVAATFDLQSLVAESQSLTRTLTSSPRFRPQKYPFLAPLHSGDAVAVIVGTTDAASVGYSFVIANKTRRENSAFWFFWRDEYQFEHVADNVADWLDSFLGYALAYATQHSK
ncbi:hypothetical protein [Myxococcus sp. AB056]|uniref:hypothetical protein n=1 Tax=Myxococcus sp. AB056 TaxID=2562792 RepID=UPI0011468958|nr:hypothetical protein [Myxococcus sp. AB056]